MPTFGSPIAGVAYADRPGAYALMTDDHGNLAVLVTPVGCFLPGGGLDPGETAEVALVREVREEMGCAIAILAEVDVAAAAEFIFVPGGGSVKKVGRFFTAILGAKLGEPTETNHDLNWVTPEVAATMLKHEFQRWAVRQAFPEAFANID